MTTIKLSTADLPESRMLRKRMRLREDIIRLRQRMHSEMPMDRQVAERLRRMIALREELLAEMPARPADEA